MPEVWESIWAMVIGLGPCGHVLAQGLVEREFAVLYEQHGPDGGDGLGDRGDAVDGGSGHGGLGFHIGEARAAAPKDGPVFADGGRDARELAFGHGGFEDGLGSGGVERGLGLGDTRQGCQQEGQKHGEAGEHRGILYRGRMCAIETLPDYLINIHL
jgi:hypothetical protein